MTEIQKKTGAKKTTSVTKKVVQTPKNNKDYDSEINDLKNMVRLLTEKLNNQPDNSVKETKIRIDSEEEINVISLCNCKLNLSTEPHGHGEVYEFFKFGDEKSIPYGDLKKILNSNRSFAEKGLFYIDSSEALSALKLTKLYEKLVDKDTILNLFDKDSATFVKVFSMMSDGQREFFASMIVDKICNNESIDLNLVDQCSKILGNDKNLMQDALNKKKLNSLNKG